jgi:hypothetical protein
MPRTADYELWKKIIRDFGCERVGYLPLPSTLHFSADWKNSRHSAVGEVLSWLSTIDQSTWWPSVFRHDVGMPPQPQAAIFTAMEHDGDEFVDSIRQATIAVMDRQAWQAIRHIVPSLSAARTRLVELERQLETMNSGILQKDQDAAKLRSQLEAIFASSSWRVTAPLRMARRLFQRLRR